MIFAILFLLIESTEANQCNNICPYTYIKWIDLKPVGCDQTTMWSTASRSKLSCASACTLNKTCAAFLYSSQSRTCSLCQGDQIQSLNFTSVETFFWPQQFKEKWPYNINKYIDRQMTQPIVITTGTVVHMHGFYYNLSWFNIDFWQDSLGTNVTFHFKSWVDGSNVPRIVLNYRRNSSWGTETRPSITPYPFKGNTTTTVDILVTKYSYEIYIDQKFCCSYNHIMPFENTHYLRIAGFIDVYELRL